MAILVSALAWQQSEVEKNYANTVGKVKSEVSAPDPVVSPFFDPGATSKPVIAKDPLNLITKNPNVASNSKDPLNLNSVVVPYKKPKIYYAR